MTNDRSKRMIYPRIEHGSLRVCPSIGRITGRVRTFVCLVRAPNLKTNKQQALLKAKYSPPVAAASCTQKNKKKPCGLKI